MTEFLAQGELVGIRAVTPEDDRILYDILFDPEVQRCLNFIENDTFEEWVEKRKTEALRYWLECIIVSVEDGTPMGYVSLGSSHFDPSLVILLLPGYRGHGIGTEASRLIVDCGFAAMGITRIDAGTKHFNTACQRMLDKVGFVRDPDEDTSSDNAWGEGKVTELCYHLDREIWQQTHNWQGNSADLEIRRANREGNG